MATVHPFEAYAFAAQFNLREVERWLPGGGEVRVTKLSLDGAASGSKPRPCALRKDDESRWRRRGAELDA